MRDLVPELQQDGLRAQDLAWPRRAADPSGAGHAPKPWPGAPVRAAPRGSDQPWRVRPAVRTRRSRAADRPRRRTRLCTGAPPRPQRRPHLRGSRPLGTGGAVPGRRAACRPVSGRASRRRISAGGHLAEDQRTRPRRQHRHHPRRSPPAAGNRRRPRQRLIETRIQAGKDHADALRRLGQELRMLQAQAAGEVADLRTEKRT